LPIIRFLNASTTEGAAEKSGPKLNPSLIVIIALLVIATITGGLYLTQTSSLQAQNSALITERNALAANYSQLSTQYSNLWGEKETLQILYNNLESEHALLQEQLAILNDVIALENQVILAEDMMVVVPEGGSVSIDFSFEYVGYIEVQYSSPSLIHFTITYNDHVIEARVPADGTSQEGQIRLPVLLGSCTLKIFNDDSGTALVTYGIEYVS
jgi:hypothetical protein